MGFDIETYKRLVQPVDLGDIDFSSFERQPLDADVLRCLRYMHDVEQHTVCYLRDLLVTRAHRDPELTTFLTFWNYEEFWHGEAIGRVLEMHGEAAGGARLTPMRQRLGWKDGLAPFSSMALSSVSPNFTAVHMTWGAVNEWTTQAGYARLAARADHPVLAELLRRIMRQEGRHIDFYVSQAKARLGASRAAQWLTRTALTTFWRPVGSSVMPASEVRFLLQYLFEGDEGEAMAARIDRRIRALPGLGDLAIVSDARRRTGTSTPGRRRPTSGSPRPHPPVGAATATWRPIAG
jgi:hypothetical protein